VSFSTDPRFQVGADDDAPARRVLLLFAASLVVIGLCGLLAVTVTDWPGGGSGSGTVTAKASGALSSGIGPQPGVDLATYTAERATALSASTGDRTAVVSLPAYVNEAQARAVVGSARVVGLLAAVPGGLPGVVTGSMADWVNAQVADKRSDRDEMKQLVPTVDDPQFKAFYQDEIARLDKLLDGVEADGPLVFGVVVEAPSAALQALGGSGQVRLVDVAPAAVAPPGTAFRGVRPEETAKANDPPNRPT
jgi:hypothetical protein